MYKINLLPGDLKNVQAKGYRARRSVSIFFVFLVIFGYIAFLYYHNYLENELAEINREIEKVTLQVAYAEELKHMKENKSQRLNSLYELTESGKSWTPVLLEIKKAITEEIKIDRVDIKNGPEKRNADGLVSIKGTAYNVLSAGVYLEKLREVEAFSKVELNYIQKNTENEKAGFKITVYIKEGR